MGEAAPELPAPFDHPVGEGFDADLRLPMARHANKTLREAGMNSEISLGEHGDYGVENVRFRDALEPGMLLAYIRREAKDHKVITITSTVIALGAVAAGIQSIRHRKK